MCEPTHLVVSVKERGRGRGYNLKKRMNNIMLCHNSIRLSTDFQLQKSKTIFKKNCYCRYVQIRLVQLVLTQAILYGGPFGPIGHLE